MHRESSVAGLRWLAGRTLLVVLVFSVPGIAAATAHAVTLQQSGPYNCGGLESTQCEMQFVGRYFGGFDASEAPLGSVKVSMAGLDTRQSYLGMIRRVERLQQEHRPIVVEPADRSEAQTAFALATLFLFDQGTSASGTPSYIDESLFPEFGGWWSNPEYTVQGVRTQNGVWARSFATTWAVVALPGTPQQTVKMPYRVRRANTQERFVSFTIRGGEGRVLYCEPEQTEQRADCPGYYGPEAELNPQPVNPWPFR